MLRDIILVTHSFSARTLRGILITFIIILHFLNLGVSFLNF
jgi:hypothetical protein